VFTVVVRGVGRFYPGEQAEEYRRFLRGDHQVRLPVPNTGLLNYRDRMVSKERGCKRQAPSGTAAWGLFFAHRRPAGV
jgi:hypothetical protein